MYGGEVGMDVYDAIFSRRSIRRFSQRPVAVEVLKRLVDAGRVAPSAANLQPLEYMVVLDKELCAEVFSCIGWAAYIKPKWSPAPEERPMAYIVVLVREENRWYTWDVGLAAENIMLAAEGGGLGSCLLLNIQRERIREILQIPEQVGIDSVIALGYKAESSVIEPLDDSVKYWRDEQNVMHVPKRSLADILHINVY